jgi:hypothetical protein
VPENRLQIAGQKTPADWRRCRTALEAGADATAWTKAFNEYFIARLNNRYRDPVKVIQEYGAYKGEGFAILTIQCSLIEYLESTIQGTKYRYARRGQELGQWEYSGSREIYVKFLSARPPFNSYFDETLAIDFYVNVRCGLLHEARTKGGWVVHACDRKDPNTIVDRAQKTVYRDGFQNGLNSFVDWYYKELIADAAMQEAFIRKFDDLCA